MTTILRIASSHRFADAKKKLLIGEKRARRRRRRRSAKHSTSVPYARGT
jgi:hypothetical protein